MQFEAKSYTAVFFALVLFFFSFHFKENRYVSLWLVYFYDAMLLEASPPSEILFLFPTAPLCRSFLTDLLLLWRFHPYVKH